MGQTLQENGQPQQEAPQTEDGVDPNLSVLSDLLVYDTIARTWSFPEATVKNGTKPPTARYAHLSAVSNGCLMILVRK